MMVSHIVMFLFLLIIDSNLRSSAWLMFFKSIDATLWKLFNFKCLRQLQDVRDIVGLYSSMFPVYRKLIKTSMAAGSTFLKLIIFGGTSLGKNFFASKISLKRDRALWCQHHFVDWHHRVSKSLRLESLCHRFSSYWKPGGCKNRFPQYGICFWFHQCHWHYPQISGWFLTLWQKFHG